MQVKILGSAAAEGWPALFCECAPCREARRRGGRNIRRRTVYALNDDTLVDFGPDIYWQSVEFGIDLAAIRHLVLTHSHGDHLSPPELHWRRPGFSLTTSPLTLYGNEHVLRRVRNESGMSAFDLQLELQKIEPGMPFEAGSLRIVPLRAQHAEPDETALNFIVSQDGKALLIANDTGWWEDETWESIQRFQVNAAIIDCTYGLKGADQRWGHLGAAAVVSMRDRLVELGVLKAGSRVVANHFSHNGAGLYEDLCEWFAPHGIEVGYDGMTFTV